MAMANKPGFGSHPGHKAAMSNRSSDNLQSAHKANMGKMSGGQNNTDNDGDGDCPMPNSAGGGY